MLHEGGESIFRYYKKTRIVSYWVYTNYPPYSPRADGFSEFITLIFGHVKWKKAPQEAYIFY